MSEHKIQKILVIAFLMVFLIIITGCSVETDNVFVEDEVEIVSIDEYIEPETPSFDNEIEIIDEPYIYEPVIQPQTTDDMFEPMDAVVLADGMFEPMDVVVFAHYMIYPNIPEHVRFHPFGELHEDEEKASFVIFIKEGYQVEQEFNLLRVTSADDTHQSRTPIWMEITQVSNITVEEKSEQIIENLGRNRRLNSFLPPMENFPFASIWLVQGDISIAFREMIYIRDNMYGGVFVVTISEPGHHTANLRNTLKTLDIITESKSLLLDNNTNSVVTIQDLFDPKFAIIYIEGTPEMIRYYPFGEIVEPNTEGMASYVIFIDDFYQVEQQDNQLRAILSFNMGNLPEISMEITQVANTTVEEMERAIKYMFDFSYYYIPADEYFPFVRLMPMFDDGLEWDSVGTVIYIKDNAHGGVFVITTLATSGHGIRFRSSLRTLEIIEA